MTVATELAKSAQSMVYFLCIEGVGWPVSDNSIGSGLNGDVFFTSTPASAGGCTAHIGLLAPDNISDSLDPLSCQYSIGGMNFEIVDYDSWWLTNYRPHQEGSIEALNQDAAYIDTTLRLTQASGSAYGSFWIGGRELVLAGSGSDIGGGVWEYTGCTRGYLGTHRGNPSRTLSGNFAWPATMPVYDWGRFWRERSMQLWAVPADESLSGALLLWSGKLRAISEGPTGTSIKLAGAGDPFPGVTRRHPVAELTCYSNSVRDDTGHTFDTADMSYHRPSIGIHHALDFRPRADNRLNGPTYIASLMSSSASYYALAFAYQYRTERGGTSGAIAAWDAGDVQALSTADDDDVMMSYVLIEDKILLAKKRAVMYAAVAGAPYSIDCDLFSYGSTQADIFPNAIGSKLGNPYIPTFSEGVSVRFLLDNHQDAWEYSRFAVNKQVLRNPVDVLLMFLTTRDDEYFLGDAAVASTSTNVIFASPGFVVDQWAGAALHCVEGDNKGECRLIASNDTTSVTVASEFSYAPGVGDQYQIRNSIYDVLPYGWGLNIPWNKIDVASFETVRDTFLADATLGKFILGVEDVDIWELITTHICKAYGIVMRTSRATGKMAATYMGYAGGDGVVDDYVSVLNADIIDAGEIDRGVELPVSYATLTVRSVSSAVVSVPNLSWGSHPKGANGHRGNFNSWTFDQVSSARVPAAIGGKTTAIPIPAPDLIAAWADTPTESLEISALFNTADDCDYVTTRIFGLIKLRAVPPPRVTLTVDCRHMATLEAGVYCVVTWDDAPINPFTGARGWSQLICRVIGSELLIGSGPAIRVTLELLQENLTGLVAPAALLHSPYNGSDGTSHWLETVAYQYAIDRSGLKDFQNFVAGDRIEVRDKTGAVREGPFVIRSFGANDVADPTAASDNTIRVTTSITSTPASGDYVTYAAWSNNNSANMDYYAGLALSTGLMTSGDSGKKHHI